MISAPPPIVRVAASERSLLSISEPVLANDHGDHQFTAAERELVGRIFGQVRLSKGHEVYVARFPIESYPPSTPENPDPHPCEPVVARVHNIGMLSKEAGDNRDFVRQAAWAIEALIEGPPLVASAVFIYRVARSPMSAFGTSAWYIRLGRPG